MAPATVLHPNMAVAPDESDARVDHAPGRWLGAARRLPDDSLALDVAERCLQGAAATLHVTRAGARFLGRGETATCARVDTTTDWLSPDDRWYRKRPPQ